MLVQAREETRWGCVRDIISSGDEDKYFYILAFCGETAVKCKSVSAVEGKGGVGSLLTTAGSISPQDSLSKTLRLYK